VSVERVVDGELLAHVVEIIRGDASETVGDRFEADPFGRPISFGRVRRANNLRQLDERSIFVQVVAPDLLRRREQNSPWCPSSALGTSKTVPSVMADQLLSCGRKTIRGQDRRIS